MKKLFFVILPLILIQASPVKCASVGGHRLINAFRAKIGSDKKMTEPTSKSLPGPKQRSFNSQPILLSQALSANRVLRSFVKNIIMRGGATFIFAQYAKVLSLITIYLSNSYCMSALQQLIGASAEAAFTMSVCDGSRMASPRVSPPGVGQQAGSVSPATLGGTGNYSDFPGAPVTASDGEPISASRVHRAMHQSSISRIDVARAAMARSAPGLLSPPAALREGVQAQPKILSPNEARELTDFARQMQHNTRIASEELEKNLMVSSHNKILLFLGNGALPILGLLLILLSNKLEPFLDQRLGRQLIDQINSGAVIKVPDNEFVRLVFESFAIGGYMYDSVRLIQSVRTLRAACLAVEKRSLATGTAVDYVYWCDGAFLKNIVS